jgi:hypothetical protein
VGVEIQIQGEEKMIVTDDGFRIPTILEYLAGSIGDFASQDQVDTFEEQAAQWTVYMIYGSLPLLPAQGADPLTVKIASANLVDYNDGSLMPAVLQKLSGGGYAVPPPGTPPTIGIPPYMAPQPQPPAAGATNGPPPVQPVSGPPYRVLTLPSITPTMAIVGIGVIWLLFGRK